MCRVLRDPVALPWTFSILPSTRVLLPPTAHSMAGRPAAVHACACTCRGGRAAARTTDGVIMNGKPSTAMEYFTPSAHDAISAVTVAEVGGYLVL